MFEPTKILLDCDQSNVLLVCITFSLYSSMYLRPV